MSAAVATPEPVWTRPPPEEWDESVTYTFTPDGADPTRERIKVRMVAHSETFTLIEFAVVHQTYFRSRWRDVCEADSCHDTDAHIHRYARSTSERTGNPEVLIPIARLSDVQSGYDAAYDAVVESWADNRRRWHDA